MVSKNTNLKYINLLKVLAMFFVVCMHVISKALPNHQTGTLTYNFLIGLDILLRSSVPIFVLISGTLMLNKKYNIKDIIKKLIEYYILFIIFNSMYLIFDKLFVLNISLDLNVLKDALIDSLCVKTIYQMWYFKIIFITYASVPLFQYFISRKNKYVDFVVLITLILLFQIIPWFVPVFYSNYTYLLVFLTYFYMGYYFTKYKFKYENIPLLVLFVISYIYTYTKTIVLNHDYYYLNFIFFNTMFISLFIFMLFESIDKYLKNEFVLNIIKKLSTMNFGVFIFHGLVIGGLSKINIINVYYYDNVVMIIFNTLLVYMCSLLPAYVLNIVMKIVHKKLF